MYLSIPADVFKLTYNTRMLITILTLFPDFFLTPLQQSILKRAQEKGAVEIKVVNIRDFTNDERRTTDDRPYGGGAGMVMKVEPIAKALESLGLHEKAEGRKVRTILTSAKGKRFEQASAKQYALLDELVIICGHYEGVDERVAENLIDEEVRIGEYVLSGGEPAALVMVDAVTRLLPGVLGNEESTQGESHEVEGVGGYPQYTRPEEFQGWKVPEILLQGHHAEIEKWREKKRPKLNEEIDTTESILE